MSGRLLDLRDPDGHETRPAPSSTIHIGTSGWSYDHWQGIVYRHGASSLERLAAYTQRFDTVEVNNTFYRWPRDEVFANWHDRTPEGFLFSAKASRILTHLKKLNDPAEWVERMERGMSRLAEKRGVLLVQLPPFWTLNLDRLDGFLQLVPVHQKLAVEFRHPSWHSEEVFNLLERRGAAYCVMSGANLPCVLRATAPYVYVRLHGPDQNHLYGGSYSDADLAWWADRIREWTGQGREVFAYFNNDGYGHAVHNAARLREMLGA